MEYKLSSASRNRVQPLVGSKIKAGFPDFNKRRPTAFVTGADVIMENPPGPPKKTSTLLASAHEYARSLLRSLYSVHVREHNKQLGPPAFILSTATCIRACASSDDCYAHAMREN